MTMRLVILRSIFLSALLSLSSCANERDIEFEQIYTGFNGPSVGGVFFFQDQASVDSSWIKKSMKTEEFERMLTQIDFDHQILFAFSAGSLNTANGPVIIKKITQFGGEPDSPIDAMVRVGSIDSGCSDEAKVSYPFALAVLPRQKTTHLYGGFSASTFPNGCAPRKSGKPNDPRP